MNDTVAQRRILGLLFAIGLFIAAVSYLGVFEKDVTSAADVACPSGINLVINGGTSTSLSGVTNLIVGSSPSNTLQISRVTIFANNQAIGQAQPSGTYSWNMPWVTNLMPNGPIILTARLFSPTTNSECVTPSLSTNVQNSANDSLETAVTPNSWSGPISFSFPVNATLAAKNSTLNLTPYALYQWTTTIGSISPTQNTAQFSSGQTQGSGAINVSIRYGGQTVSRSISISVKSPDSPLPETTTSSTGSDTTTTSGSDSSSDNSTAGSDSTSASTTLVQRTATLQNNPIAQSCIVTAVGKKRFDQINKGEDRPKPSELPKLSTCFAPNNYILPSNFAPVAPTKIKDLGVNNKFKVAKLENVEKENDNGKSSALKITGQATPNSVVLIYVFSDPLVLTTTAGSDGNWTYTLEDPIEPGSHEVYSVVDRGDGVYERSSPFSFIIGTAEAAQANPNGLSLQLAETPTPSQSQSGMMTYIIGSAAVLIVVLVAFFFILRRKGIVFKKKTVTPVPVPPVNPAVSPIGTVLVMQPVDNAGAQASPESQPATTPAETNPHNELVVQPLPSEAHQNNPDNVEPQNPEAEPTYDQTDDSKPENPIS